MPRSLPAAVALALLWLGGCAAGEPADPLVAISGPREFSSFELRDADDRVIWSLAADPPAAVSELFYGTVPPGFGQQSPAGGVPPRPLVTGERLSLDSITPRRIFRHEAYAEDGPRLSIVSWAMTLRRPAETARAQPGEMGQDETAPPP